MRLNRYLASAGLGSRRSVEALIQEGQVKINGQVVDDLATTVGPGDVVKVRNAVVSPQETVHAVLYKPRGFLCTASDERERRTIFDLLPTDWPRVYHVGRLDMESEGLLIVTNDGDLAMALTHPSFKLEKEYEVTLDKPFEAKHAEKLLRGFHIEGGRAKMENVEIMSALKLRVILTQGIKRQIRLMLYDCGYEVEALKRVRIGTLHPEKLRAGMWRMLSPKDVADLKAGRSPKKLATRPAAVSTPTAGSTPAKGERRTERQTTALQRPAPRRNKTPAPRKPAAGPSEHPRRTERTERAPARRSSRSGTSARNTQGGRNTRSRAR
jgi:23S rRNA pseudouridine2605 synthase